MLVCYHVSLQVIPAIDLLGDEAVRLERGDYDRVVARRPVEEMLSRVRETAPPLIHVVDLDGARDGALREEVFLRCREAVEDTPVQVSGGLRTLEQARRAIDLGASRVVVATALWSSDDALAHFADALGERLVAAIDVREGRVAIRGWFDTLALTLDDALARCRDAGVVRVHVTAIERDGTLQGPDLALYERACASGLRVLAAGGVRDERDLAALTDVGCEGVVVGLGYFDLSGPNASRAPAREHDAQ